MVRKLGEELEKGTEGWNLVLLTAITEKTINVENLDGPELGMG